MNVLNLTNKTIPKTYNIKLARSLNWYEAPGEMNSNLVSFVKITQFCLAGIDI